MQKLCIEKERTETGTVSKQLAARENRKFLNRAESVLEYRVFQVIKLVLKSIKLVLKSKACSHIIVLLNIKQQCVDKPTGIDTCT